MNDYVTEKEQLEMFRKWWNNWGKYVGLAILIGLIVGLGWRYWSKTQTRKSQNASMIYTSMSNAHLSKNAKLTQEMAALLIKKYKKTPYAAFAAMLEAKQALQKKQDTLAIKKLQWVLTHNKIALLKQLARLRIARIQLAQKQPKTALLTLKTMEDVAFKPMVEYVQSAAYTQLGNAKKARQLLESAKSGLLSLGVLDPLIEMKLANGDHAR